MEAVKLLIVAHLPAELKVLCKTLDSEEYSTVCFTCAEEALPILGEQEFDLLLTDLVMPQMSGIALLRAAHIIDPDLVGVVMARHGTIDTAIDAMKAGAIDYIQKPFKKS